MDSMYKFYCMSKMLFDKGTSYMVDEEIEDYKKTIRVFGPNKGAMGSLYDLTYKATPIIDNILLGNAYNARNYYELEQDNIGLIINCSRNIPDYFSDNFEYHRVSVKDKNGENILPYLNKAVDQIKKYIDDNPDKKVLVHCFMGSSRSATIVLAYLMKYKKYRRRDALNFLKQKRDIVNINIDFFKQLKDYEEFLLNNPKFD